MRILYVTIGFPYPLTSGYLRHYHYIRGLSERHEVTLLSVVGRNFQREHAEAMAPFTTRVLTFGVGLPSPSKLDQVRRATRSLIPGKGERDILELQTAVARCLRDEPYDVVLFSGRRTSALAGVRDIPLVVDMCDATSMGLLRRMPHCGLVRLPTLILEYLEMRRAERRLLKRATHLLFATCRDRDSIVGKNGARASVIPNGVDLDYWKRNSAERGRDTIILTGAMDYAPNRDAALYLIRDVLPRVRRSIPGAELWIVGRDPTPQLVRAAQAAGAHATGFVEDVRPYLEQSTVAAAPLRFGAGIQNKLLEAMAMGVPVVTSPLGADGLRTEGGDAPPLGIARSPQEFAELIVRGLVQGRHDPSPDASARRYVEQNFVWSKNTDKLEQVMISLAAGDR